MCSKKYNCFVSKGGRDLEVFQKEFLDESLGLHSWLASTSASVEALHFEISAMLLTADQMARRKWGLLGDGMCDISSERFSTTTEWTARIAVTPSRGCFSEAVRDNLVRQDK